MSKCLKIGNKGKMGNKYLKKENYLKSFIKFHSLTGNKSNFFPINPNESNLHRDTKYKIGVELIKRGFEVIFEAEFKTGGRADICAIDPKGNGYIFEVVNSESEESIKNKLNKYPIDFVIEIIKCSDPLENQITI